MKDLTSSPRLFFAARLSRLLLAPTVVSLALSATAVVWAAPVANADAAAILQDSSIAGFGPLNPAQPSGITAEQIVKRFGEREAAFAQAREAYVFRESVRVDTLAEDTGKPDGTYQQVTDISLADDGKRLEHVVFAPANTLERVMLTQADFDDIAHRLPFVLTTAELPQYDLTYLGRQHVDDLDTYVFECKPKRLEKNKRYFQGKVWVDQKDFQIVLINGKSVPDDVRRGHEDLSPPYTTYYQEVDNGYWFPVYTRGDGVLHFPGQEGALAQDVHIRYVVKFQDYKRFRAKSRIIYNGQDLPAGETQAPSAEPNPPAVQTPPATPPK